MFKEKTMEEYIALTAAEREQYDKEFKAHRDKEWNALKAELAAAKSKGDGNADKIAELEAKLEEMASAKIEDLEAKMLEQGKVLTQLLMGGAQASDKASKELDEKLAKAVAQVKVTKGMEEIEVGKAVGPILTTTPTAPDGLPAGLGVQIAPPSPIAYATPFIQNYVTTVPASSPFYVYSETIPKEGDAAYTAEGALKPGMDFKTETRTAQPVKVAVSIEESEEAMNDIPRLRDIINSALRARVFLKQQMGILFGDGISPNPKGAIVYAKPFVAGGIAASATDPNIVDVINAMARQIVANPNFEDEIPKYPTLCLMHIDDFTMEFIFPKDQDGRSLYPTAVQYGMLTIGGITVMPNLKIASGKIFVADMSRYNISNYSAYVAKVGYINDQFKKNMITIIGELRHHAFVKKLDEMAFIYDAIATVKAAIAKP